MKNNISKLVSIAAAAVLASTVSAAVIDFEDIDTSSWNGEKRTPTPSADGTYNWQAGDCMGNFSYDVAYNGMAWNGFKASQVTDTSDKTYNNDCASNAGGGAGGSLSYGILYGNANASHGTDGALVMFSDALTLDSIDLCNTAYVQNSVVNGDGFADSFADIDGEIYFNLRLRGMDIDGNYSDDNFLSVLLDVDYLCLAVATTHPFARLNSVSLGQLKKEPFILRPVKSNSRTLFENHLISRGENIDSFNVIMEVDSITTIKELVARGLGVTIIAYSAVKADVMKGNLSVIPVENLSMPREINLVYHKDFEHKEILNEIYRIYQEEKNLAGEGRLT